MNNELIEQIKANVPLVYEAGKNKGIKEMEPQLEEKYAEGIEEGYDNGLDTAIDVHEEFLADKPKTYRDIFWDSFTNNGTRTDYKYAFYGWKEGHFNPTRDIKPKLADRAFYMFERCDLKARFEECGCKLDFSNVTSALYCFGNSKITALPELDCRKLSSLSAMFNNNHALKSIEKIILKDDGRQKFDDISFNCNALEEIRFEGVIGTTIIFQYCPMLSKASIENIINCLSTTTSGLTVTLSAEAVNNAFTDTEWTALENTKSNWTISLV